MSLAIEWTSPVAQQVKESASTMTGTYRHRRAMGWIPGSGRFPGEGNGN